MNFNRWKYDEIDPNKCLLQFRGHCLLLIHWSFNIILLISIIIILWKYKEMVSDE
jgi:hypothetical protein